MTRAEERMLCDIVDYLAEYGSADQPATKSEAIRFAIAETHRRLSDAANQMHAHDDRS